MKKRLLFIPIIVFFISLLSTPTYGLEKIYTETQTSNWSYRRYGPTSTIHYDDGDWYGDLFVKNVTYSTQTRSDTSYKTILTNSKPDDIDKYLRWFKVFLEDDGYTDVVILNAEWRGSIHDDGDYLGSNGKEYDYKRSYKADYTYTAYRHTVVYEGTLTAYNVPPEISNAKILNQKNPYTDQDKISIQTTVKDIDIDDDLTLYVNGVGHGSIVANGSEQIMTVEVPADENLDIHVEDTKGAESNHVNLDAGNIANLLEEVDKDINKFVAIEKNSDLRFIVFNTEDSISTSTRNTSMIDNLKTDILDRNADLYGVGTKESKSYIEGNLTEVGSFTENDGTQENNIVDFIIKKKDAFIGKNTNVFVVGDTIKNNILFEDLEKDYHDIDIDNKLKDNVDLTPILKKPKNGIIKLKYIHDPSIFDYPEDRSSKDDGLYHEVGYTLEDDFVITKALKDYRGKWVLYLNGKDSTRIDGYDKQADEKRYEFYIHEKPVAIISINKDESPDQYFYSGEQSYDIDYKISKPNLGIKEYTWKYQLSDGTWDVLATGTDKGTVVINKIISGLPVTNIALTVEDWNGATDTTVSSLVPPILKEPKADFEITSNIYVGTFGSDRLSIESRSTPSSVITDYEYDFDFASTTAYLDLSKHTVVDSKDYTFEKNTLKTDELDRLIRKVKFTIDFAMPFHPHRPAYTGSVDSTKDISFIPVSIIDYKSQNIYPDNMDITKYTFSIKNSNGMNHEAFATISGVQHDMVYIGDEKWEVTLNTGGATSFDVRIENESDPTIIYDMDTFKTNRPPTIDIESINPKFVYEGDMVKANIRISDPDYDPLDLTIEVYKDGHKVVEYTQTVNPDGNSYDIQVKEIISRAEVGTYEVIAKVVDPFGEIDRDTEDFISHELSIDGYVTHTPDWESNRNNYNNDNRDNKRDNDVFWAGEKFILSADTTVIDELSDVEALSVHVEILSTPYNSNLASSNTYNWTGILWNESMLERWNKKKGSVRFRFRVNYSNGTVKLNIVTVMIDDLIKYWNLHRKF